MQRNALFLTAALLVSGAGLLFAHAAPPALHADEESAADRIARLMPDLLSEKAEVRERAERQVLALGAEGRAELERIARDNDPAKAKVANRLLDSKAWDDVRPGEERIRREGDAPQEPEPGSLDERLRRLREQTETQLAEFEKRMRELQKSMSERLGSKSGGTAPGFSQKGQWSDGSSSFSWEIDGTGRVKVTTKDGDAPAETYEAESLDKLREAHPDVAKRLEERTSGIRIIGPGDRWPGVKMPDLPEIPGWKDFDEHFPDLIRRLERGADGRFHLRPEDATPENADAPRLGITVEAVPDVLRDQIDVPELRDAGLVVRDVTPGSIAERLGLRRNDVLLRVGSHMIRAASDVRAALGASEGEAQVTVEIVRKGRSEKLSAARTAPGSPK